MGIRIHGSVEGLHHKFYIVTYKGSFACGSCRCMRVNMEQRFVHNVLYQYKKDENDI